MRCAIGTYVQPAQDASARSRGLGGFLCRTPQRARLRTQLDQRDRQLKLFADKMYQTMARLLGHVYVWRTMVITIFIFNSDVCPRTLQFERDTV